MHITSGITDWEALLGQIIVIVTNAGIPVIVTNILKNFFPKMDGKSDKIVNWFTIALFAGAVALNIYNPDLLAKFIPLFGEKMRYVGQILTIALEALTTLGLVPWIYSKIKGKINIVGKSFSASKK